MGKIKLSAKDEVKFYTAVALGAAMSFMGGMFATLHIQIWKPTGIVLWTVYGIVGIGFLGIIFYMLYRVKRLNAKK